MSTPLPDVDPATSGSVPDEPGSDEPGSDEPGPAPDQACLRCGLADTGAATCPRCGMPWVGDVPAVGDPLPAGVRAAGTGRRVAAVVLDLLPVLVLGLAALLGSTLLHWSVLVLALLYLVVVLLAWVATGRSPGRRLLSLRTVDAASGEPVGALRLLGRVGRGRAPGLLTADLRAGRDPLELPVPSAADLQARRAAVRRDDPASGATPGERALLAYAAPRLTERARAAAGSAAAVGLVLGNGQRYDVAATLLLGRNPVDTLGEGAVLASWPDMSRRLAKTHLRAERIGPLLWVTDLSTPGGSALTGPDGLRRALEPGVPAAALVGTTIECGGRTVRVVQGG